MWIEQPWSLETANLCEWASTRETICLPLKITIRLCQREDLKKLEWHGLFSAHRRHIKKAFERQMAGRNVMLLAEFNGEFLAQVWVDFAKCTPDPAGYIWALRVIPWLQGCGLGTKLIREAEQLVFNSGRTTAVLDVHKTNVRARALYEKLGYSALPENTRCYGRRRRDEIRMHKELFSRFGSPREEDVQTMQL